MTASQILGNFCWQNCHLFQVLAGQWFPDKHISRTLSRDLLLNWVACDQKMLPFLGFRASFRVSQKSSFSLWERWVFQFGLENVSRKHYYWLLWWAEQLPLLPNSTHRHYREPCVCVCCNHHWKKGNYKVVNRKTIRGQLYWKIHCILSLFHAWTHHSNWSIKSLTTLFGVLNNILRVWPF